MMRRCLYCYTPLSENENDFHAKCSKKIFGHPVAPVLPYTEDRMEELAAQIIQRQVTVTGVQPKLSLHLESERHPGAPRRFTIVGLWGDYVLKPPTPHYSQLPEVEDLTMHLADLTKIQVVPHSLIRLQSGNLAYITKRIDRTKNRKLHMEDMCQITERLTENKYQGSYEQIAKAILAHSANPGLDVVNFFESVVFSFLTGNADMHLKNFSLIHRPELGHVLSPAYDLVATSLVNPGDDEDMALTLNGKKKRINRDDFVAAFETLRLQKKQQESILRKMTNTKPRWTEFVDRSFLTDDLKTKYRKLIDDRFSRLGL